MSESTGLFGRLARRMQQEVPDQVVALGLFRNARLNRLPMDLIIGVTEQHVYVFALCSFGSPDLVDVWDRADIRATAEEHHLSWEVHVNLSDGRRFDLAARRHGANRVNGEAVSLLTAA